MIRAKLEREHAYLRQLVTGGYLERPTADVIGIEGETEDWARSEAHGAGEQPRRLVAMRRLTHGPRFEWMELPQLQSSPAASAIVSVEISFMVVGIPR